VALKEDCNHAVHLASVDPTASTQDKKRPVSYGVCAFGTRLVNVRWLSRTCDHF